MQYALSRRPNVKLVETGLGFGVEGFRNFEGRVFGEGMGLTRRFYPHKYNVDGFFVSKLKKTGPTVGTGRGDALREGKGEGEGPEAQVVDGRDVVHGADEQVGNGSTNSKGSKNGEANISTEDTFGGWDSSEDEKIIERARRRRARKKGVDPSAVTAKAKSAAEAVEGGS